MLSPQGHLDSGRLHGLDALRAFALCLGIVFHADLAFLFPGGKWAVGTTDPPLFLVWFDFYCHSFRMEIFFLLAGFFSRLAIERKGPVEFARDRFRRIFLVLILFIVPIKYCLTLLWIWGGVKTGWLVLPPEAQGLPLPLVGLGALFRDSFPHFGLAHLWFLYYLSILIGLLLLFRWIIRRAVLPDWVRHGLARLGGAAFGGFWAPWAFFVLLGPLMALMEGSIVETPDRTLVVNPKVLGVYGICFFVGYWLHSRPSILLEWARWGPFHCALGLGLSLLVFWGGSPEEMLINNRGVTAESPAFSAQRWVVSTATMAFSLPGWVGLFLRTMTRAIPWVRYVANASYWLYLAHLPIVVFFQVLLNGWSLPWWLAWFLVNLFSFPLLFASYHYLVRFTWLGVLLNGQKR